MGTVDYAKGVRLAYCGEVRGAITFAEMAEQETDPGAREMWRLVAAVEALTRDRLAPLAERLHGRLDEAIETAHAEGLARAADRRGVAWREIAEAYVPHLPVFLERFEALETLAPAEDRGAIAQLTEHSRAFGDCIRTWLDGDAEGARRHLQRYLDRYRA